jgi:hypothetical protein
MSKKNMAGSLVEGGKSADYKYSMKVIHKRFRKLEKMSLLKDKEFPPSYKYKLQWGLERVYEFADKISIVERFKKKVGFSLEEKKSYLLRKYGRKSLRGWHLMTHFEELQVII